MKQRDSKLNVGDVVTMGGIYNQMDLWKWVFLNTVSWKKYIRTCTYFQIQQNINDCTLKALKASECK